MCRLETRPGRISRRPLTCTCASPSTSLCRPAHLRRRSRDLGARQVPISGCSRRRRRWQGFPLFKVSKYINTDRMKRSIRLVGHHLTTLTVALCRLRVERYVTIRSSPLDSTFHSCYTSISTQKGSLRTIDIPEHCYHHQL